MISKAGFGNETAISIITIQSRGTEIFTEIAVYVKASDVHLSWSQIADKMRITSKWVQQHTAAPQYINNFIYYSTPITFHESSGEHLKSAPWL